MIVFPNSKINLGLNILSRRDDGFHNLKTLFYPLGLCDCLEIIPAKSGSNEFQSTGIDIPSDGSKNLCEKAVSLLRNSYEFPPVTIHLHKSIPIGAGLGGGSSDAAFTLKLMAEMFIPGGLPPKTLSEMAAQLGSDCAFFIQNIPCLATGRGEILSPYPISLAGFQLVLIMPDIHISTREAFAGIEPRQPIEDISTIISEPIENWKNNLVNDFEKGIFARHPQIRAIKEALYEHGAVYASMSGSGASVFGLFRDLPARDFSDIYPEYFIWKETLKI
jgi:4-diphosphocytidyl-2-C-methyl-D-erythritol kinase